MNGIARARRARFARIRTALGAGALTRISGMAAAAAVIAGGLLLGPAQLEAADVEVDERAGEAIGRLAETVRDFRLTSLPSDLQVEAETMVFDFRKGELVYKGDVDVKHGGVRMRSDELKVTFAPKDPSEVKQIQASGNVRVAHETETASGRLALYDPNKATITLTGDAHIGSGPNKVRGEKVVVFLDEGRAVIEGGASGPVRAHIEPKSDTFDDLVDKKRTD